MKVNYAWRDCSCKGRAKILARSNIEFIGLAIMKDQIYICPNGGFFPLKCPFCGEVGTIIFGSKGE